MLVDLQISCLRLAGAKRTLEHRLALLLIGKRLPAGLQVLFDGQVLNRFADPLNELPHHLQNTGHGAVRNVIGKLLCF